MSYVKITPDPRILRMLGEIPLKGWQCIAELIDNSIDGMAGKDDNDGQNEIKISLPSRSEINNGDEVRIIDNGTGMTVKQLNNAVRAGYSGKVSEDNLGLFGMGFNISTARLGNLATIWTSTVDDDKDIGVEIDLIKMQRERSFSVELKERKNSIFSPKGASGTEIKISKYNPVGKRMLYSRPDIIRHLRNAYSESLFSRYNINIVVNGEPLKGKRFCIWDDKKEGRYAIYKSNEYPPFIEIDKQLLRKIPFCNHCISELNWINENTLPIQCDYCQEEGQIIEKQYHISGWIGIQRFFSEDNYGLDIVRNGRIIESNVKEIFTWIPRDIYNLDEERINLLNPNGGVLPEYPIDNKMLGGRIVGEVYADFIKPKYTKDSFDRGNIWQDAMEVFRGKSPLQVEWATTRLGMRKNNSPLSKLFHAYRKTEPGQANLVCGAVGGSTARPGNQLSKSYHDKFVAGDPDYQDDEEWYKLVLNAEPSTDDDEPRDIPGGTTNNGPSGGDDDDGEKYPGSKRHLAQIEFDLESKLDIPKKQVTIKAWHPDELYFQPIVFIPVEGNEWHFLVNQLHNMVRDFPEGWEDLVLMEAAYRFVSLKDELDKWTLTTVYYELKKKYFEERLLHGDSIFSKANNLINDIIDFLVQGAFKFERKPSLNEEELLVLRNNYLEKENKQITKTTHITVDSTFLGYMNKEYIFKFIDDYPHFIFDGRFFDLPYLTIDDKAMKHSRKKYYDGLFADVEWLINELPSVTKQTWKQKKSIIIKAKMSLEELISTTRS